MKRQLVGTKPGARQSLGALQPGGRSSGEVRYHLAVPFQLESRTVNAVGWIALGILVHDVGRPDRFHHMVMTFTPTSPMSWASISSWPTRSWRSLRP